MNVPTSTSTPIRKDIDAATLHRLYHEEDMTIKGIAELCGICPATVRKYLGPVGKGKKRTSKQKAVLKAVPKVKPDAPVQLCTTRVRPMQLMKSKTELRGKVAVFEIDHNAGTLYVRGSTYEMLMPKEEVEQLIWELVEAYDLMPRMEKPAADETEPTDP